VKTFSLLERREYPEARGGRAVEQTQIKYPAPGSYLATPSPREGDSIGKASSLVC